ncbi:MAG: hypothetical protein CSH37_13715 [Thalassolituus sp.]|nr:MAG: hypothetical protein CSH37_13715 [Thalassolituus sp.]
MFRVKGRSLGNLNLNANGERVHIPVISEDAFKQVAGAAANIGLAGSPLAFNSTPDYNITDPWAPRNLPFSSVMLQAQAFGWLDALDFIIPVSSIMVITEQIGRIGTEEFEPVALIIAGLDVALVFSGPLRGPLKLAFDPLAKLISNPATQKLAKILGPFFGNIIEKVAKSRSTDPILTLLPFLMIVGEIAADEEAREAIPIIIDAINSSEDLQVWFDYFNLPDDGWEGDTQPQLDLELASLDSSALPLGMLVPQAYAAGKPKRVSGSTAGKRIKEVMKSFANGDIDAGTAARSITTSMKVIIKEGSRNTTIRQALTDPKTLKAGMTLVLHGGIRHFKNLLSGKDEKGRKVTARTPVFLQLAAIAYLESNINCEEAGCWKAGSDDDLIREIRVLYGKALGSPLLLGYDNARVAGYQFQLTMAALLHAMDQVGVDTYGKIVAIEDTQRVFLQQYQTSDTVIERDPRDRSLKGDFNRKIDFVLDNGGDKPLFLEVKSYKGRQGTSRSNLKDISQETLKSRFNLWNMKSDKGGDASNHKQYTADRILVTDNARITNPDIRDATKAAGEIKWLFQNYSQETVGGLSAAQIKLIRKWLSRAPTGIKKGINASLGLKDTQSYTILKSEDQAGKVIDLFNMKTLFQDSGSALVERLFDMGSYTPEEKAKMQDKIKELVENLLPDDVTVD